MAKSKDVTRQQAEGMKAKAADFMDRIADSDRADDFDGMTVDEYAEHKGLRLTNRSGYPKRRIPNMPKSSNADLQDQIDQINDILSDDYDPTSSREDLAAAIGQALDTINADDGDADSDSDDDEDDDSDSDSDDDDDARQSG